MLVPPSKVIEIRSPVETPKRNTLDFCVAYLQIILPNEVFSRGRVQFMISKTYLMVMMYGQKGAQMVGRYGR